MQNTFLGSTEDLVKSCTASSIQPGYTCDGIYKTGKWFFGAENSFTGKTPTNGEGEWVTLEFKSPLELGSLRLKHYDTRYNPDRWKFEGYSDGKWFLLYNAVDVTVTRDFEVHTYQLLSKIFLCKLGRKYGSL